MKHITYTFLLLVLSVAGKAQNLVTNGNFEHAIACPQSIGQVTTHCADWVAYNQATPDYFHTCNTNNNVGVPINAWGYQQAASGNAYVGLVDYYSSLYREYIYTTIAPLQIGNTYEISMSVSLSNLSSFASNGLGVLFFDNGPTSISSNQLLTVTPQVSFSNYGPITDTVGWVRLSALFYADSAYDNIVIGGFVDNASLTTVPSGGNKNEAYYYIDSVVLEPAPPITITFPATQVCAGDVIYIPYQLHAITFNTGNMFTLQLSNAAGSFSNPVNIGTVSSTSPGTIVGTIPAGTPAGAGYKLRAVSSTPATISNMTQPFTVNPLPTGTMSGSNSPVCAGKAIQLTASSSSAGVTYSWTGPAGFMSGAQNPIRNGATVAMSGYYKINFVRNGCIVRDSVLVDVHPTLNISAGNNSPICNGGTLTLTTAGGPAGTSYSWTGPNNYTSAVQNPTIINVSTTAAGTYAVVGNSGACMDTAYTTVTVGTPPATPSAGSNSPVCSGNNISLNALSVTSGVSYQWTGPGGYAAAAQNPTRLNATTAMSGSYQVVAVIGACPSASATTQVIVHQTPAAPTAGNNGPLCSGIALDLFATGMPGATYHWTGPGGYNTNTQNPTILNANVFQSGTYSVTQTVNGCTSAAGTTQAVVSNAVYPSLAIFVSPNDTICTGQAVTFVASPTNGGTAPQYQWKKNGNSVAGSNGNTYSSSVVNTGDIYSCEMISNAACPIPALVQSNDIQVTVEPPQPCHVSIAANPGLLLSPWQTVTFTATPAKGGFLPSYQWLRNGQPLVGAISNTWSANNLKDNDTISVVLFSTDPCAMPNTDTSSYLVVRIKTGISDVNSDNRIALYPNPNKGDFTIKGSVMVADVTVDIVNMLGQTVYRKQVLTNNGTLEHTVHLDAASGMYLLKVVTGEGTELIRFEVR